MAFQLPRNLNKKHGIFMFFFKKISDLNIWISRSYIWYLLLLFHSQTLTIRNCLTCSFSLHYQYILQPTVLANRETYTQLILCVKPHKKAKETTSDEPGQMEILWQEDSLLMWWAFSWKKIQFRMALFYPCFTLGTLATVTIFLNLKTCFAEDNWPRA